MNKNLLRFLSFTFLIFSFIFNGCKLNMKEKNINSISNSDTTVIFRTIDVSKTSGEFPALASYWNTSVQKAPAPVIGDIAAKVFGKANITRCWLNLDEMWDYRNRQFTYDFKLGVDKYKAIKEKHRESWDWQEESPASFYQYMDAFSSNSEEIMLTIRRYERDILDKKLPISMEDWKIIFKTGLKHYKERYLNIRYIEVGNEYALKSFMHATPEEYYQFYKLGYEAVNEINQELDLKGNDRILIGGPVVTGDILKKIDSFLSLYSKDNSKDKKVDFISWHDYHKEISVSANRQKEVEAIIQKFNLPENLLLFVTEHDPFHFKEDKLEYHDLNAAYLPKSLYFASQFSPNVKVFPWVLYHRKEIQTKFMWFTGPNEVETEEAEIKMLPLGCSVKFLSMLQGEEVSVENTIDENSLVLAAYNNGKIVIEAINYEEQKDVMIAINSLEKVSKRGKIYIEKYLIDSNHSNCLTNPEYHGGIEKIEETFVKVRKGQITLEHTGLEKNGLILWVLKID